MVELLTNLYGRWADEKQFESFDDYTVVMSKTVEALGGSFVRGTKRPFGCVYEIGGFRYQIRIASRSCSYARIGIAA